MYQWVKCHQDISKAANKNHATLNKLVDELASKARDETLNGTREAIKILLSQVQSQLCKLVRI